MPKAKNPPVRVDYGSHLNLFGTDVDLCRDAFERYIELCEKEIAEGRQNPFYIHKRNMERLLDQLNRNDPLRHDYKRPDPEDYAKRAARLRIDTEEGLTPRPLTPEQKARIAKEIDEPLGPFPDE